jgi:hypothetical protein
MVKWIDSHGRAKTDEEKIERAQNTKKASLHNNLARRDEFIVETQKLGLDPATKTLFDWLEDDDKVSFTNVA